MADWKQQDRSELLAQLDRLEQSGMRAVPVLFSVGLLRQMAEESLDAHPQRFTLLRLGEPDDQGFYNPLLGVWLTPPLDDIHPVTSSDND